MRAQHGEIPMNALAQAGRMAMRLKCIAVALAETPDNVLWIEPRKALTGRARPEAGGYVIAAPRPFTRRSLYIFLHECGHVALGHLERKARRRFKSWEREQQAEQFAQDRMRAHGLAVPRKELLRGKLYVEHKREFGRRIARGRPALGTPAGQGD